MSGTTSMTPGSANLASASRFIQSSDPRAPKADLSNARHLFGDIEGNAPYGFPDDGYYGDVDENGDINTAALNTWETLVGDAAEEGAPRWLKPVGIAAGIAGAGYGISRLIAARRRAVQNRLNAAGRRNTISTQIEARRLLGRVPKNTPFPFYQVIGATLNGYPLSPVEAFAADTLKYNLDRQATETPFEVEIVPGTFAGVTWTLASTGVVATRFYVGVLITVGISVLTANPGTIFNVAGTFPLVNGATLTVAANPWSFTIRPGYYAKIMIFPWQLVTNKPLLALGAYNSATPITVTITGLPSNASVSMVIPGSQHPWTIGMRNRLL